MRGGLIAACLGPFVFCACYLSHPPGAEDHAADADAGHAARDAATGDDAVVTHRCTVTCGAPELIAVHDEGAELQRLVDTATIGSTVGVLAQRQADDGSAYELLLFDADASTIRTTAPADRIAMTYHLSGGALRTDGVTFVGTTLRAATPLWRGPATVEVGVAGWDAAGALLHEEIVGAFETRLEACGCPHQATAFGAGDTSFALLGNGATIEAIRLRGSGTSALADPPIALVTMAEDLPSSTPLSGALLRDGTLAIGGGGLRRTGGGSSAPLPRAGFVATGRTDAAPFRVAPTGGAVSDPPPLVEAAAGADAFFVFRHASDTADLGRSRLHIETRDRTGALVAAREVPLLHGLTPVAIATYASERGAGVVWVDTTGAVHLVPTHDRLFTECAPELDAPPVATLPGLMRGMDGLAAAALGDDVIVFALEPTASGPRLIALRIPACHVG